MNILKSKYIIGFLILSVSMILVSDNTKAENVLEMNLLSKSILNNHESKVRLYEDRNGTKYIVDTDGKVYNYDKYMSNNELWQEYMDEYVNNLNDFYKEKN